MLRNEIARLRILLLATIWIAGTVAVRPANAADECTNYEAKVIVVNKRPQPLTAVGIIHRYGASDGDVDQKVWENIAPNDKTSEYTVHTHTITRVIKGDASKPDWWTVVWSYKEDDEDKAFQLNPPNGQRELEQVRSSLLSAVQTISTSELKSILSAWSPSSFIVEPVIKVTVALIAGNPKSVVATNDTIFIVPRTWIR
ncbi:MAG: hypothetical protein WDN31_00970 [Hyphomicrobium sp.]